MQVARSSAHHSSRWLSSSSSSSSPPTTTSASLLSLLQVYACRNTTTSSASSSSSAWIGKTACVISDRRASSTAAAVQSTPSSSSVTMDMEDLHRQAVAQGSNTYTDPETGFTVFTEVFHLKRGNCCGCRCRHCPYEWANVKKSMEGIKSSRSYSSSGSSSDSSSSSVDASKPTKQQRIQPTLQYQEHPNNEPGIAANDNALSKDKKATTTTTKTTGGRKGGTLTSKNVPYTRTGDNGTSQLLNGERRYKTDAAFEAMGTIDELCSFVGVVHANLLVTGNRDTTPATTSTTIANDAATSATQTEDDTTATPPTTTNTTTSSAAQLLYAELPEWLLEIMSRLFDIGSQVATPPPKRTDRKKSFAPVFTGEHTLRLEEWIDQMTDVLPELSSFILPTGTTTAAHLHVARCVCRRAERRVVALQQERQEEFEEEDEYDEAMMERDQHLQRYLNRLSDFFFTAARFVNYCEGQESEIQYRRDFTTTAGTKVKQRQRVMAPLAGVTTNESTLKP